MSHNIDAHTAEARELIRAGKLSADDPRNVIVFEEPEQSEIASVQCLKDENQEL